LRRDSSNRIVAGVASGLGRYLHVDPVIFRVLFPVLTLFGGVGLLLYLLGWLLLPDDVSPYSPAESLVRRGTRPTGSMLGAIALGAATLFTLVLVLGADPGGGVIVIALIVAGGVLLLQRRGATPAGGLPGAWAMPPASSGYPGAPSPAGAGEVPPTSTSGGAAAPGAVTYAAAPAPGTSPYGPAPPPAFGPPASPPAGPPPSGLPPSGLPPSGPPPAPPYRPSPYGAPPPPPNRPSTQPRERSALGRIVVSLILLSLGIAALLDRFDVVDVDAVAALTLALALVGAGLLVGSWWGRSRLLLVLGLVLGVALISAIRVEDEGSVSRWTPANATAIEGTYQRAAGQATLDLREVEFPDQASSGATVFTSAQVGAGDLTVLLPPEVDVRVTAQAALGELNVLGLRDGGAALSSEVFDEGRDGPGGGSLDLTLNVGVGEVTVTR